MKRRHVIPLLCLLIGLVAGPVAAQDSVSDLFGRINALRASLGLPGYTFNRALNNAAQQHANWMMATGTVSHYDDNGSGPRDRANAAGYQSTWVSENIYMGSRAGTNDAWNFWLNSPIHYKGLTNLYYREIGIGVASGNGGAFVLVFGNPAGALLVVPVAAAAASGAGDAPAQPSYVVGQDEHGNIMHEIQPGDTLGQIALIYGYTWENIPYMLEINGLTQADSRVLEIGAVFLVPPQAGTFTPTAAPDPSATPLPPTATRMTSIPVNGQNAPSTPVRMATPVAVVSGVPSPTRTAIVVAEVAVDVPVTPVAVGSGRGDASRGMPVWLLGAILVQVAVVVATTGAYVRRLRR